MREVIELIVNEHFASMLFGDTEGHRLSDTVRKIIIDTSDRRYDEIGRLQRKLRNSWGTPFFYGWQIKRSYTNSELRRADLFLLKVTAVFEPTGEECGTVYDESAACPRCRSGAVQVGPLYLKTGSIPKGKHFAQTIADELVISSHVKGLFERHGVTGMTFAPVIERGRLVQESKEWFQLRINSSKIDIVAPTRVGNDPFDDDPYDDYRCPRGDLIGLNLLSEVSIDGRTYNGFDFNCSRQFIGVRRGVLRPRRLVFISPKVLNLIATEKLKGASVEIAHLV